MCPTFIIMIAPACSGMSVCIEWTKHMSSTILPTSGKISLTHLPLWPYCLKPNGEGIRPFFVFRSVLRSTRLGRLPGVLRECRFVVKRVDLRRATRHEQLNDVLGLGREVRCLGRERRGGRLRSGASSPLSAINPAKPIAPMPAPNCLSISRRVFGACIIRRTARS